MIIRERIQKRREQRGRCRQKIRRQKETSREVRMKGLSVNFKGF